MVQSAPNQKQEHLAKADVFFQKAQSAAEAGDVSSSGSFILKALEQIVLDFLRVPNVRHWVW